MESNNTSVLQANRSANSRLDHGLNSESAAQDQAPLSARLCLDISKAKIFHAEYDEPPFPVLAALGGGRIHQFRLEGSCDLSRAVEENKNALIRSFRDQLLDKPAGQWDQLIFQFGAGEFLHANERRVVGYAASYSDAERLALECNKKYGKPKQCAEPCGGSFQLVMISRHGHIGTETVTLDAHTILSEETLELCYSKGFANWHTEFSRKLCESRSGLAIFEGSPGTGKTTYLRHLMGALRETHRFYFIPPSNISVLSTPIFIEFWSDARRTHSERKFLVIIEDSDAALMTRANDNRDEVSAILNLSDGMLADFLRLQIICTINCLAADIDPALLRPRRLLCHRVFNRLDRDAAERLAKHLGRKLPTADDYSLAEIFAGDELQSNSRNGSPLKTQDARIGFAA